MPPRRLYRQHAKRHLAERTAPFVLRLLGRKIKSRISGVRFDKICSIPKSRIISFSPTRFNSPLIEKWYDGENVELLCKATLFFSEIFTRKIYVTSQKGVIKLFGRKGEVIIQTSKALFTRNVCAKRRQE